MMYYVRGQQGATSILAIGTMVFLGILIAGLLPFVSSLTKTSTANDHSLKAQYAAEAGAKRTLVSFAKFSDPAATGITSDWSWVGNQTKVINDDDAGAYTVTIKNPGGSSYIPSGKIPDGVYTAASTGTFQKATCTVYIDVPVKNNTVDFKAINWRKK